jgi:GxxExxY protein
MGVLFKVHNKLGPSLFQRGIASELETQKLTFKKEVPIKIEYQGQIIGRYFLDFIVENLVVLEIKAERYYTLNFLNKLLPILGKQIYL